MTAPWYHLVAGQHPLVFVVEGSRLFEIDQLLHDALVAGEADAELALQPLRHSSAFPHELRGASAPSVISLNVAQSCNLACSYCYADEGRFGGRAKLMSQSVAVAAVDRLIDSAPGRHVTIGFIGGEPLLSRSVIREVVAHAQSRARERALSVGFSIATNATLLTTEDSDLFRDAGFDVSVSLDGDSARHDLHRPTAKGAPSHAAAVRALQPLLQNPGRARVTARATVPRTDLNVCDRVESLRGLGFREVGVSPVRTSPNPSLIFRDDDWAPFLAEMVRAGECELARLSSGLAPVFSNLMTAVRHIHRGAYRRLPCGAGDSYVSVSATGDYFTCHRTVDKQAFHLGSAATGPSPEARRLFVLQRDVQKQEPCRSCWARHLCGGGCHAEVLSAGRTGCDFIRGWLDFCLGAYDRILRERPKLLDGAN
jgi:uncharacterized protein